MVRIANVDEVIRDRSAVTRQQVTMAKGFLQRLSPTERHQGLQLIDAFALQQGFEKPLPLQVDGTADTIDVGVRNAVGYLNSGLAMGEALWSLIGAGYLLPEEGQTRWQVNIRYNHSHGSDGSRLDDLSIMIPANVRIAPSYRREPIQPLTDPDIFLAEAGLKGMHDEVLEALADAIACLKRDLYRPAVTMLGKAAEGAWVELAIALAAATTLAGQDCSKLTSKLQAGELHFSQVVAEAIKMCRRQDLVGQTFTRAGISLAEVEEIANWSHVVRDARNAIHFGSRPVVGNSYEKVAALLLGAALNLRTMSKLKKAAEEYCTAGGK